MLMGDERSSELVWNSVWAEGAEFFVGAGSEISPDLVLRSWLSCRPGIKFGIDPTVDMTVGPVQESEFKHYSIIELITPPHDLGELGYHDRAFVTFVRLQK